MENQIDREPIISEFIRKNSQLNLSAIRDHDGILVKHIHDSLELNKVFDLNQGYLIGDVGTGSGFPLIPLAITNPSSNFTGIDSIKKKVGAVNEMLENLEVTNAKVMWSRAEDFGLGFDIVIARAVAMIDKLITRTDHLVLPGGIRLLFKPKSEEEFFMLQTILKRRKNLTLEINHEYTLFDGDIPRIIYGIRKK